MLAVWLTRSCSTASSRPAPSASWPRPTARPCRDRRRDRLLFRTFSLRDFFGWGGRYVWRFLGVRVLFCGLVAGHGRGGPVLADLPGAWAGANGGAGGVRHRLRRRAAAGVPGPGARPLVPAWPRRTWRARAPACAPPRAAGSPCSAGAWARSSTLLHRVLGAALGLSVVFLPLAAVADSLLSGAPGWRGRWSSCSSSSCRSPQHAARDAPGRRPGGPGAQRDARARSAVNPRCRPREIEASPPPLASCFWSWSLAVARRSRRAPRRHRKAEKAPGHPPQPPAPAAAGPRAGGAGPAR